jgi:hypothetical protein
MKTPLTPEIRTKANEMFYRGQTRHSISEALGLTLGQVSALAAHRMMRNRKTLSARAQLLSLIQPTGDKQPRTNADSIIHMGSGLDGASVTWNPDAEPNPHLLVVGESGSGKTFAISSIVSKLRRQSVFRKSFRGGAGRT